MNGHQAIKIGAVLFLISSFSSTEFESVQHYTRMYFTRNVKQLPTAVEKRLMKFLRLFPRISIYQAEIQCSLRNSFKLNQLYGKLF